MPKITDINSAMEKRIVLSPFFGEEAFITIKRMNKYQFSFLLNKNRGSYSAKIFSLMTEWKEENQDKEMSASDYDKLRNSIDVNEVENMMMIETEVNRGYFESSIKSNGHNFMNDENHLIELNGGFFFDNYSGLSDPEGRNLTDFLIGEIVSFNHKSVSLGESIPSR